MDELEKESMRRSFLPEEAQVDGYCHDEEYDRERDPSHKGRVLAAVRDFMATRKRKRKGQVHGS